jgi:type VI secretion system secreted protein VgrG
MAPLSQQQRISVLRSPLGEDVLTLSRLDAGEGVSQQFQYRIEAVSETEIGNLDSLIGQHFTVKVKTAGEDERIFDGVLTDIQWMGFKRPYHIYRIVLGPWSWFLTRTMDSEIFTKLSAPDIIKKIFDDNGLSDYRFSLSENYPIIEYCVQYRETDLAFISRLMEQYGIYYFFEHKEGKHIMVLGDARSSHSTIPNHASIQYIPVTQHGGATDEHIYRIAHERRFRTGRIALNDYDYLNPNANLEVEAGSGKGYTRSSTEAYEFPGNYTDPTIGEKFAKVRLEAEQALDHRRHAAGDAVSLFPGGLFTLAGHETEGMEYLVVQASHSFVTQHYRSVAEDEGGEEAYFGNYELQPADIAYRAPFVTERPVVHGPQTAKVVGKSGEEIDVDEHGRILVQFFWDRQKVQSCRVRVAQIWADKRWGAIFIPRIGSEVVVDFIEGDPDRPFVTGCVYNGDNKPPYDLPGEKNTAGIKSNSTKGGGGYNELAFIDTKGDELVRGHAQHDLQFKVLNDEKWDIGVNSDTKVGETLTIEAGMKIEFKVGKNRITIDQTGVTVKGVAQIEIQSPMTTTKGDAIMTVQGGLVKIN